MSTNNDVKIIYYSDRNILVVDRDINHGCTYNVVDTNNKVIGKIKDNGSQKPICLIKNGDTLNIRISCVNNIQKNIDVINFLHSRCPDLLNIDYMFDIKQNKCKKLIVKGYVQSGKTSFMLCSALKYLFNGSSQSSIIILRDSISDRFQIKNRLNELKKDIINHLYALNKSFCDDFCFISDSNVSKDDFKHAMSGVNPKIFIVLGNKSQLKKLNDLMRFTGKCSYSLMIDEGDLISTGENNRCTQLDILKEQASSTMFVSATVLDIGLLDHEENSNIYVMNGSSNYMGINSLKHRCLLEKSEPSNKKKSNPFELDENLIPFLRKFNDFDPHYIDIHDKYHPQHCLMYIGSVIEPQRIVFKYICKLINTVVILYNGDGIELYHSSITSAEELSNLSDYTDKVNIKKCKWFDQSFNITGNVTVSHVLQWLKDNGGVEKFPRIITLSGRLAGRGISFTSLDYGKYLNKHKTNSSFIGWRLTSMYFVTSKHTNQPNLIQAVGRLCCVRVDNIETYIYTTPDIYDDIRKAYWTQEELIERARQKQVEDEDIVLNTAINKVKMCKDKLCTRSLTVNGVRKIKPENIVGHNDDGFDFYQIYQNYDRDMSWDLNRQMKDEEEKCYDMDPEEFNRLINLFNKWSNESTKIACFMQGLDPNKIYKKHEIDEHCLHNNIRLSDVTFDKSGKSNKYGDIIKVSGYNYCLHPCLIEQYVRCF